MSRGDSPISRLTRISSAFPELQNFSEELTVKKIEVFKAGR
jgi:hypothetical protein